MTTNQELIDEIERLKKEYDEALTFGNKDKWTSCEIQIRRIEDRLKGRIEREKELIEEIYKILDTKSTTYLVNWIILRYDELKSLEKK